jgi:peptidoglycan/LPS O-acetylase OafA/YrhL
VPAESSRLTSLDGLRGVAAVVVVLYHGTEILRPTLSPAAADAWSTVAATPVKLLFAGTESVLIFFVLSGLVVTLPALRPGFSWAGYYPARLLRLYLPVWGALVIAAILILVVPRSSAGLDPESWLATANSRRLDPLALLREASLTPASYDIDNVLWSLRWEVAFSLALPVFAGLAVLLRRVAPLAPAIAGAALLSLLGRALEIDALVYLPVFLAGALLAARLDTVQRWAAARGRVFWIAWAGVSAALLIASWLARPLLEAGSLGDRILWGLAGGGAVGFVVLAIGSPAVARALSSRALTFLGEISFSLYLVHVPVLATLAFGLGPSNWPWVLALGIPLSLLLAILFQRLVDAPSHRLARRVGRAVGGAVARRRAAPAPTDRESRRR